MAESARGQRNRSALLLGGLILGALIVLGLATLARRPSAEDRAECFARAGSDLSLTRDDGVPFGAVDSAAAAICGRVALWYSSDGAARLAFARILRAANAPNWRKEMLKAAQLGEPEGAFLAGLPNLGIHLSYGPNFNVESNATSLPRAALQAARAAEAGSVRAAVLLARYRTQIIGMTRDEALNQALGAAATPPANGDAVRSFAPNVLRWLASASAQNDPAALYEAAAIRLESEENVLAPIEMRDAEALLAASAERGYLPAIHARALRLRRSEDAQQRAQGLALLERAATARYRPAMLSLASAHAVDGDLRGARALIQEVAAGLHAGWQ